MAKKLLDSGKKEIRIEFIKNSETDEKMQVLTKPKKRILEAGSTFKMSAVLDFCDWDPMSSTYLPKEGPIQSNLSPEDLKHLNLETKEIKLEVSIRSEGPLIKNLNPAKVLSKYMSTTKTSPKHEIKEVLKELVRSIKFLIPRIINDYISSFDKTLLSNEDFKKLNVFTEQQKINFITQRKGTYLTAFFSSKKFVVLQKYLQSISQRLVYDKLLKSSSFKLHKFEVEKSLNSLYVETQMITAHIIQLYFENFSENIPFELKYFNAYKMKENQNFDNFFTVDSEDLYKKVKDYEKIGRWEMSEKLLNQGALEKPRDAMVWYNLMVFHLRRQNMILAEGCFDRCVNLDLNDMSKSLLQICFLLKRKRILHAEKTVVENLNSDRSSVIDNLLMSFIQENYREKPKVGRKYFKVARKKYMRSASLSKNSTNSGNSQTDKSLALKEEDLDGEVWKELIVQMMKFNFVELVKIILPKIESRPVFQSIVTANILLVENNFEKSNENLESMMQTLELSVGNQVQMNEAILTKAGNCFFLNQFYEAEFLFLRYFKMGIPKKNVFDVLLMMGQCYLNRQSFLEAEEVFLKLTTLRPKSAVAWTGLGVAAMNLENLERAEEALFLASKLEHFDFEIIAHMILLFLKKIKINKGDYEGTVNLWEILKQFEVDNLSLVRKVAKALEILENENLNKEAHNFVEDCIKKQKEQKY